MLALGALIVSGTGRMKSAQVTAGVSGKAKPKGAIARISLTLIAASIVRLAAWPDLPDETRTRLSSMLSLESDYNMSEDVGRMQIWKRGMRALADRPIGYGIAAFPMADLKYGGRFFTAHNSLVLIAVELGVVGIFLYIMMITSLWRQLGRSKTLLKNSEEVGSQHQHLAVFLRMAQVSLLANLVAGFFLSAAFFYSHWVNIALAMSVVALINREYAGTIRAGHARKRR
jgi:O-antigen ligase